MRSPTQTIPTPQRDRSKFWRRASLIFAAASSVFIFAGPVSAVEKPQQPTNEAVDHFRAGVRELREILRIPGLSIAVLKDGAIVYQQKEGFANLERQVPISDDNLFQIASITKTFTANLVMQYEEAHLASLEDYALNYRFIDTHFGWPYNIDPNTRVRHFLSHTSEDGPGRSFVYNGQRFNYIFGLFEAVGKYPPNSEAYSQELKKRIFAPLELEHTIAGFPKRRDDPIFAHIATPYIYDREKARFVEDVANYQWTQAYPATGIITTIGDLAKYAASYKTHSLISEASYAKITSPQRQTDGSLSPYGIGWFTESFAGKTIHWHYGHADSYAALFVRVPESRYTFLFLSNSNAPSDALRLGAGHIWQSPFVTLFLRDFVFAGNPVDKNVDHQLEVEHAIGKALFSHYAAQLYHSRDTAPATNTPNVATAKNISNIARAKNTSKVATVTNASNAAPVTNVPDTASATIEALFASNPERFDQYDPALVMLLSEIEGPHIAEALEHLITAFERYGHPQPYVSTDLAKHFERRGDRDRAFEFYRQVADSTIFETWDIGINACMRCGEYLLDKHQNALGRQYFWKAVTRLKSAGADDKAIQAVIDQMNAATAKASQKP
ncbi:MAG TPA: serine hydrolase domain-containing protein [Opitutaceae bacterium]|nr:serine hydrolase domain-containing protein [Opitutaceae bacterium]